MFAELLRSSDEQARALAGRLLLACHSPLDKVPFLGEAAPVGTVAQLVPYRPAFDITGADIFPVSYPPGKHAGGRNRDIGVVGDIARKMVTKWGLSEKLGPLAYAEDEGEVFLGRSVTQHKNVSNETAHKIDEVVRDILDHAYGRTKQILTDNIDKLHVMADALLQYETIDARQIDDIMNGRESWSTYARTRCSSWLGRIKQDE